MANNNTIVRERLLNSLLNKNESEVGLTIFDINVHNKVDAFRFAKL